MLRGLVLTCIVPSLASAGNVVGKIELPPAPDRPPVQMKGFLDRVENPLANVKPFSPAPDMAVVLEGEGGGAQGQVTWDLAGETFIRHVLVVPAGTEVLIKNTGFTPRTITAAEDAKLVAPGPLNPRGAKTFKVGDAGKVYTFGDRDAPHIKGRLVVIAAGYSAAVDDVSATAAKFEIDNVTPGRYTLRIYYKDRWLDVQQQVDVPAKGKVEPTVKLPAWPAGDKARP